MRSYAYPASDGGDTGLTRGARLIPLRCRNSIEECPRHRSSNCHHTRIVWNRSLYDIDSWAIPKGSPKQDEAYRFIAFASSPERQKALSERLAYGPTNRLALTQLPKAVADSLPAAMAPLTDALGNMRVSHGPTNASRIGRPGNAKEVSRTIAVTMSDAMRFTPDHIEVHPEETIRLVLHNQGRLRHELVLGEPEALRRHAAMMKMMPDMQHSGPNMASLAPGEDGEIIWKFTHARTVTFACLQAGHLDKGMRGVVSVQ